MGQKWICCERKRISNRISTFYPRSREYVCDQERNTKAIHFITFVTFLIDTFGTDFALHLGPYSFGTSFMSQLTPLLHLTPINYDICDLNRPAKMQSFNGR